MNSGSRAQGVLAPLLLFIWALAIVLLPLGGLFLTGIPSERYFEFPPRALYVEQAAFSWRAFVLLALLLALWVLLQLAGLREVSRKRSFFVVDWRKPLAFILLLFAVWLIAWQRFALFSFLQEHTFFLIWMAYIALAHVTLLASGGTSPFSGRASKTAWLFIASAGFWWLFEWLNRFVQNWSYRNVEQYSAWEYFFLATLSFSTVLPATLLTKELLGIFLKIETSETKFSINIFSLLNRFWGCMLLAAALALTCVGKYPNELFPFLWLSPLIILAALARMFSQKTFLDLKTPEQFVDLYLWSASGLWCGFLWELWNVKSLAGWSYSISYVDRFHLFEMPLLGYGGYLPFGVLCGLVCALLGWGTGQGVSGQNATAEVAAHCTSG